MVKSKKKISSVAPVPEIVVLDTQNDSDGEFSMESEDTIRYTDEIRSFINTTKKLTSSLSWKTIAKNVEDSIRYETNKKMPILLLFW